MGATALDVGDVMEIELHNSGTGAATFGLTSVTTDADQRLVEDPDELMFVGSVAKFGLTVSDRPSWIVWGGFRHLPEPGTNEWRWAVTDAGAGWLPVCFVDQPGRAEHGLVMAGTHRSGAMAVLAIR